MRKPQLAKAELFEGAQVFVVPPEHDREFSLRSRLKNQHEREWQELSQRRPALNAPSEEQELYHLELEIFREKFQTNTSRLSQLWKRQKLGENLVYLEAGREELGGILRPLYPERERARREFEDWHQRQLRGFNMLNTESSERPSYIS